MADIVDDCRAAARTLEGWGKVVSPGDWIGNPSTIAAHLTKSALEVEMLRKEIKLLQTANASLSRPQYPPHVALCGSRMWKLYGCVFDSLTTQDGSSEPKALFRLPMRHLFA